jgi:RND superfamily putative drug exporter
MTAYATSPSPRDVKLPDNAGRSTVIGERTPARLRQKSSGSCAEGVQRGKPPIETVALIVAVMLIALGSDYNVLLVGRIWQQSGRGSLSDTVASAGTRASRSIATAALVLASSFALLAIVPLRALLEIAFAMAAGLLIDAFVIRAMLVPALLVLVGARSAWPGKALRRTQAVHPEDLAAHRAHAAQPRSERVSDRAAGVPR